MFINWFNNNAVQLPVGALVVFEKDGVEREALIFEYNGRWNTLKGEGDHTYQYEGYGVTGGLTGSMVKRVLIADTGVSSQFEAYHYMLKRQISR